MFFNEEMDEAVRSSMRSLIKRGFVDYFWDAEKSEMVYEVTPKGYAESERLDREADDYKSETEF